MAAVELYGITVRGSEKEYYYILVLSDDVCVYLGAYGADYKPADGQQRADIEFLRRQARSPVEEGAWRRLV